MKICGLILSLCVLLVLTVSTHSFASKASRSNVVRQKLTRGTLSSAQLQHLDSWLDSAQTLSSTKGLSLQAAVIAASSDEILKAKTSGELLKRVVTGFSLAIAATIWVFYGSKFFCIGLIATSVLALLEYFKMMQITGVTPATKTGIVTSFFCFIAAALFPDYHELCPPLMIATLLIWLLVSKNDSSSIREISGNFLGMFYLGYLPSFWARLHQLGGEVTVPALLSQFQWLSKFWTYGSVITWYIP